MSTTTLLALHPATASATWPVASEIRELYGSQTTAVSGTVQLAVVPLAAVPSVRARVDHILTDRYWMAGHGLLQPVEARLTVTGDEVIAVEPTTGIVGVGSGLASAITDLRAALVEHLDVLAASPALSPDLAEQLEFLRQRVQR